MRGTTERRDCRQAAVSAAGTGVWLLAAAAVLLAPAELVRTPVERMTEKSLRRKGINITRASVGLSIEMEETAQLTSVK